MNATDPVYCTANAGVLIEAYQLDVTYQIGSVNGNYWLAGREGGYRFGRTLAEAVSNWVTDLSHLPSANKPRKRSRK